MGKVLGTARKNKNHKRISSRKVDILTEDVNSWWGQTFVFVKKTRVTAWKGFMILAFTVGGVSTLLWMYWFNVQSGSEAASGVQLTVKSPKDSVEKDKNVAINLVLNTSGKNVVAVNAILEYDADSFELKNLVTDNSPFEKNNKCQIDGKSCQIVKKEKGKISMTFAKPSPGVKGSELFIANIVFKAIKETAPKGNNFKLFFEGSGKYGDSDVIVDDEKGTDILEQVVGKKITVSSVPNPSDDKEKPKISITYPKFTNNKRVAQKKLFDVSGTVSDNTDVSSVTWESDNGGSGKAELKKAAPSSPHDRDAKKTWKVNDIELKEGVNKLTFTAEDSAGNKKSVTVEATFRVNNHLNR
ncbi:MAG TPA: cohesin domain-containing protein [Candidatus Moranbacteria bacterium]|nr:cohesin domain-containing protein [Candidatus Moranbacteria bacterium]